VASGVSSYEVCMSAIESTVALNFNIKKDSWILPTQCICVFRMVLTINSDYFPRLGFVMET
jgi:hypothetical protein